MTVPYLYAINVNPSHLTTLPPDTLLFCTFLSAQPTELRRSPARAWGWGSFPEHRQLYQWLDQRRKQHPTPPPPPFPVNSLSGRGGALQAFLSSMMQCWQASSCAGLVRAAPARVSSWVYRCGLSHCYTEDIVWKSFLTSDIFPSL